MTIWVSPTERHLRQRWWAGFWWGALIAAPIGLWGGYLLAGILKTIRVLP